MIFSVIPFKDFEYELQFINYDGMGNEYEIPSAKDFKNSPAKIYDAFNIY